MPDFSKTWDTSRREGVRERIKKAIIPEGALRERLEATQRAIQAQISKLEGVVVRLRERDSLLFSKIVSSIQKHENERAAAYSNELAEVRKMARTVLQVKMVLEQVSLRLSTVKDVGDIVVTLAPAMSVVRGIRGVMDKVMPEAGSELNAIGSMLNSILIEAGGLQGSPFRFEVGGEDAQRILAEAAAVAEHRSSERFPQLHTADSEELPSRG